MYHTAATTPADRRPGGDAEYMAASSSVEGPHCPPTWLYQVRITEPCAGSCQFLRVIDTSQ
jgi:hypothetical protein